MNSILCFSFREGLLPHLRKFAHSDDKAQPFVDLEKHMFTTFTSGSDGNIVVCHTSDFHPHIHPGYCRVAAPK
jgi:hypothetical protein